MVVRRKILRERHAIKIEKRVDITRPPILLFVDALGRFNGTKPIDQNRLSAIENGQGSGIFFHGEFCGSRWLDDGHNGKDEESNTYAWA